MSSLIELDSPVKKLEEMQGYKGKYMKNKWIPLELIGDCTTKYAITINPVQQPPEWKKDKLYIFYRLIYDAMMEFKSIVSLRLFFEMSANGRAHFHGTMEVLDKGMFGYFVNSINLLAASEMDTIKDPKIWDEYCKKQSDIWTDFFKSSVIPHPMIIGLDVPDGCVVGYVKKGKFKK